MYNYTMKPLRISGIIDQTFKIYRSNFKAIIVFALLIGGTVDLIVALLQLGSTAAQLTTPLGSLLSSENILDALISFSDSTRPSMLASLINIASFIFITPFVTGGITLITLNVAHGHSEDRYLPQALARYGKLIGVTLSLIPLFSLLIIVFIIISIIFSFLPFLITITMLVSFCVFVILYLFAFPIALQEERYGFSWFGRAWSLFRRKVGKTVGLLLLTALLVSVLSFVLQSFFLIFLPPLIGAVIRITVASLLQPITTIAITLLYLDIRLSKEGYDLEMRAAALQDDQEQIEQGFDTSYE